MKAFRVSWLALFFCSINLVQGNLTIAEAASGTSHIWPTNNKNTPAFTKKSGLQIKVDTLWAGDRGYRPVEVTISSAKPVAGDTQVTFRFLAGINLQLSPMIAVENDFVIKQGTTTTTATLLVPQYFDWNYFNWEVWIDGRKDEELSSDQTFLTANSQATSRSALFFTTKDHHKHFDYVSQQEDFDVFAYTGTKLPLDWKYYSSLDLVFAYPDDLERWSVTAPSRFAHLLRWVRAGGNLWILETGENYGKLDKVENCLLLAVPNVPAQEESANDTLAQRGWQYLTTSDSRVDEIDAVVRLEGLEKLSISDARNPKDTAGNSLAKDSRKSFVARGYGMGTIVAFTDSAEVSTTNNTAIMSALSNSLLRKRIDWGNRHGNDPSYGNIEFGKFLIPDVGTAPVIEFQLLISLFILAIGPLNYWLLKRRNKLPLMLITVPAAALVTTVLLFTYGFVADGFGVKVRVRSLTMLDQRLGEAICWSRQSYYAGVAPSQGLTMPRDTLVYPIRPTSSNYRRRALLNNGQIQEVLWTDKQKLTKGWLASRTPTQYLTISARPSTRKISFQTTDENLTATNQLGADILVLIARDNEGKFYLGHNIDADQASLLKSSDAVPAILELRKAISENAPEFPPGLDMAKIYSQGVRGYNQESFDVESLLDDYLSSFISPISSGLDHGVYIAITATGPEVSIGVDDAIESSSFHVIRGIWSHD